MMLVCSTHEVRYSQALGFCVDNTADVSNSMTRWCCKQLPNHPSMKSCQHLHTFSPEPRSRCIHEL